MASRRFAYNSFLLFKFQLSILAPDHGRETEVNHPGWPRKSTRWTADELVGRKKKWLVGISGGVAAYKTPILVRRLRDAGAEVRVIMTAGAEALYFAADPAGGQRSSGCIPTCWMPRPEAGMGHIELARWADGIIIAPATAPSDRAAGARFRPMICLPPWCWPPKRRSGWPRR